MKKIKKIAAIFLTLIILLTAAPLSGFVGIELPRLTANAETEGTYGNLYYREYDTYVELTGCNMSAKSVDIPSKINGKPVTKISGYSFYACNLIKSIVIPDSVTSIGHFAFMGCNKLSSIIIPDTVTSIGLAAFSGTAYYDNSSNWVNGVLYIGNHLIEANEDVSAVITVNSSVKTITEGALDCNEAIKAINVDDANNNFSSKDGILFDKNKTKIICCPEGKAITEYIIPDSVINIGNRAFIGCNTLQSITIPDSVTSIGAFAFDGCSSLKSISIPDSVTSIGHSGFYGCVSLKEVYVSSLKTWLNISFEYSHEEFASNPLYNGAKLYINNKLVENLIIPDGTTKIKNYTFYGCSSLKSIVIPGSMESIGSEVFTNCSSLENVAIHDNVKEIGRGAFYGCSSLQSITIPDSVASIGSYAFKGCSSLQSITIPDSVTSIGSGAFYYCSSLQTVYYAGDMGEWRRINIDYGNDCFRNSNIIYNHTHEYFLTVTGRPASCDKKGLTDGKKCSVCNKTIEAQQEIPQKPHTPSDWIVKTEAKIGVKGEEIKKCTVCGIELESREIPAIEKPSEPTTKPSEPTTKPTEPTTKPAEPTTKPTQPTTKPTEPTTKPTEQTTKPTEPTTKPTESTTKPSEPTEKPTEPIVNFLLGDVNGDGYVKANDARTALRAAAKLEELDERALKAADIDGNGKITAAEARKILRFAAKLDKELK